MPGYELIGKEELLEVTEVFEKANGVLFRHGFDHLRNGIFKVKSFEMAFAQYLGTTHALAVTSGTAALKVALKALGIGPGDEVITQAFTFVATVEAIVECGAKPVIAEINDSLTIDPEDVAKKITTRTKAIIPVHMLGVPCDMDGILALARTHNLKVIEDTAWGCGGSLNGKKLGTIGDIGCYSFDHAKAITTGEGGMIVTRDGAIDFLARSYHDHGHENNTSVPRWEDTRHGSGFNYRMSELQGAIGLAQLRKLDTIISRQRQIQESMAQVARNYPALKLPPCIEGSYQSADAFVFSAPSAVLALECRRALLANGLGTKILPEAITWHFAGTWDHIPEILPHDGTPIKESLAHSETILRRCVAVPINLAMDSSAPERVDVALQSIFGK